jgi:colicin import membrane protein
MSTTALRHPPSADEHKKGTLLAVAVHVVLLLALALGVSWRSSDPQPLSAELWSATPRIAAPEPPAPAPPPPVPPAPKPQAELPKPPPPAPVPEADIVTEKKPVKPKPEEKPDDKAQLQAQQAREAAERRKQEEARRQQEEARRQAEQERIERQREENLRRMAAQLPSSSPAPSSGTDTVNAAPSASYAGRVRARIRPNIIFTDPVPGGRVVAEVQIDVAPDGRITGRKLTKRSGLATWDEAVLRAIERTEVLPPDVDGRVPPSMVIEFDPNQR